MIKWAKPIAKNRKETEGAANEDKAFIPSGQTEYRACCFLVLSCLLLVFSNTLYRRTVYDPYVRKLEDPAQMYPQEIPSCLESLLQYVGTEELDSRQAPDEDGTYGG